MLKNINKNWQKNHFVFYLYKKIVMKSFDKVKLIVLAFVFGISGGVLGTYFTPVKKQVEYVNAPASQPYSHQTSLLNLDLLNDLPDFTSAAAIGTEAVVNIQTEYYRQNNNDPIYYLFFGNPGNTPIQGSGSGVIISPDGYIVTNNHVVDKASSIKVTLNDKREYDAKVIGTDPSTDLALLKIDATKLSTLSFGNSDNLKVGEWVLAVGNPYTLTSTVTAGIVSAKARNISILKQQYAIESFIQTDAAVNPGNSGGALINTKGELVGINAAIASPTGSYTGYSFAIPVSIVKKVVADLIEFGSVQRAYLGANITDIDEKIATDNKIDDRNGVYVNSVTDDGAAQKAGIKEGDVIVRIDTMRVNSTSELLEQLGRRRPGDVVSITVKRGKKEISYDVTLKNNQGTTSHTVAQSNDVFGVTFEDLTAEEKDNYGIKDGVRVSSVVSGKFLTVGIKEGFIIEKINDKTVKTAEDANEILNDIHGGVYIEGYYPDLNQKAYYAFGVK